MSFKRNPNFINELKRDPRNKIAMANVADGVRQLAIAFSRQRGKPIMPRGKQTFVLDVTPDDVRVVNTSHGGHIEEWGSEKSRPYAPLRRAVRAEGLRMTEHNNSK